VKSPNASGAERGQGPVNDLLHRLYNSGGGEMKYLAVSGFSRSILVPLYRKPVPREAY